MITVEYIDHMGSDNRVCNSARVSFDKDADNFTEEQNTKLINYLAKHNHITPFMHPQITLRETVPIFVARQRFKHVIGFSYNEISRRYVDSEPTLYVPEEWRSRPEGYIKQGSGGVMANQQELQYMYNSFATQSKELYTQLIESGVAPEQARMVLPQSMLTSYYVTGSLAAFARAYNLRADNHAQKEIQDLAKLWNDVIEPLFPVSWKALTS